MADMNRVREIFNAAIERSGDDRHGYLDSACAGDAALRSKVEHLLAAAEKSDAFLSAPTAEIKPPTVAQPGQSEGQMIGRYKLLQPIGEGGFGTVWMAEQREPVKRRVALKIIKLGMDTRQVIARFEAERQALAMMDHPNIAKVLDGGATDTGRPYFVMEYIKGVPILEYCDNEKLDTRARLELFSLVCQAIQHAHQKGIIHRDIKPNNVLVTMHDGVPVPKVIDFGIAKATASELTQKTLFTEHRQMIGTPAYMSPEQAEMSGLDIDTRSDIYSLGVLLYELLTGTTPFPQEELLSKGFAEMMRIIREVEPLKPSTRLSSLGQTQSRTAQQRQVVDPQKLVHTLRGDLDWIVMKCLEKDRTRRYETASGLASDIKRHLSDEPVSAGPPTAGYRLQKFVRRHRAQVIAATLFIATLVLGIVGTTIGLVYANQAARAERIAKAEAQARRADAERSLAFAKQGNEILGSVFANLNPGTAYATVADLRSALRSNLDNAVRELDSAPIGDPLDVAAMQGTLGSSLLGLGDYEKAVALLKKSSESKAAAVGPSHAGTLRSRAVLASALVSAGHVEAALSIAEEVLKLRTASFGPEHAETLSSMAQVADLYNMQGRPDLGLPLAQEALRLRTHTLGPEHPDTIASMAILASGYNRSDKADQAIPLHLEILRLSQRPGRDPLEKLAAMGSLAIAYSATGRTDLAIPLYEQSLDISRNRLGRDHPNTLLILGNLANAYNKTGKQDSALLIYEETLKLREAKLGPDHPDTIGGMNHLAAAYWATGKKSQAIDMYEEALRIKRARFGNDSLDTIRGMRHLADLFVRLDKSDRAISLLREALSNARKKFGPEHEESLGSLFELGDFLCRQGAYTEAEGLLQESVALQKRLKPDDERTHRAQSSLALALLSSGKFPQAESLLLETYDHLDTTRGDPNTIANFRRETVDRLIAVYQKLGKPDNIARWQSVRETLPK